MNKDNIAGIINEDEQFKDKIEELEVLRKKIKKRNLILIIELVIFLVVILYSCSAGIKKHTIDPIESTEIQETLEVTDSNGVSDYSVTIGRIDIGVNEGITLDNQEVFDLLLSRADLRECYNEYYIKNVETVKKAMERKEVLTIDSSYGVGDATFTNLGQFQFVDINAGTTLETFSMWKHIAVPEISKTYTGASYIFVFNREFSEEDIEDLAVTIENFLDEKKYTYYSGPHVYDIFNGLQEKIGVDQIYPVLVGDTSNESTCFESYDFCAGDINPHRTVVVLNIDTFFVCYGGSISSYGLQDKLLDKYYEQGYQLVQ